ncbi:helix-turn-helix domain-containing protein, partial [Burkholderia sp. SIMBA_042]|uniref:TetR/AcrR family transcriptional regulator n=1 Tax=Burkholderia sp. SIMBA_042 TaxID=3085783 RepID=UPI00397862A6
MPPDVSPNPADPRFQRSYDALVRAVTELLDEAPLSKLSIAQLVQRAGVARPTFYQHFPDLQAAAQRAAL